MSEKERETLCRPPEAAPGGGRGEEVERVTAFLIRSRQFVERIASHTQRVKAHLTKSRERSRQIGKQLDDHRRFIAEVAAMRESTDGSRQGGYNTLLTAFERYFCEAADQLKDALAAEELLKVTHAHLEQALDQFAEGCTLLEVEHETHRAVFDSRAEPIVITDASTYVRDANRAAASTLCVNRPVLIGNLLLAFVARQDTKHFRNFTRPLWNTLGDEERSVVARMRPRGRSVLPATFSVRLLRSGDRKLGLHWTISPAGDGSESPRAA